MNRYWLLVFALVAACNALGFLVALHRALSGDFVALVFGVANFVSFFIFSAALGFYAGFAVSTGDTRD